MANTRRRVSGKEEKTAVLLITPETGRLSEGMGPLGRFISGKSGGMGEVIAALCGGLTERGIECHLATLNLPLRFQRESNINDDYWQNLRHCVDPDRIHLVTSAVFAELPSAYAGDPLQNAVEFQKDIVNQTIVRLRATKGGRLIVHSHDWMAGGVITAYARMRGCPILHTIHNVHTGHLPLEMFYGVDLKRLGPYLYLSEAHGRICLDSQTTAIKNASVVSFVSSRFLQEIIDGELAFISPSLREEVRIKHQYGQTATIINAPAPGVYPECCSDLVRNYGPDDDILAAKRENLVEFQKRTGLNVDPGAILLYWPSRLDPIQKGVHLLEGIAQGFVEAHEGVQIAIVGNGVGTGRAHEEICGRIAWASGGRITYQRFQESLSMLGFAAASDVFGASLYEPCGQIDQVGNLYGATTTNRNTGGYHDKIRELNLQADGAPEDQGNGFLFRDYDQGGLWYGLASSVAFHRRPPEVRETQLRRIMRESREKYSLERMIDGYIALYEQINGGQPLN
ncbi:MAG: glycogen/starch synthase [Smithellaceae bacterium]|nr:glycogen/starch synthase [Smithellaceae bacterium]